MADVHADPHQVAALDIARTELGDVALPGWAVSFVDALVTANGAGEWLHDFLSKPWKWAPELVAWRAAGEPMGGGDAGWQAFVEACE